MYTLSAIQAFKLALSNVLNDYQPDMEMDGPGLCNTVCYALEYDFRGPSNSYYIFRSLLNTEEYEHGLGPVFQMTTDRWYFGYLILQIDDIELMDWLNSDSTDYEFK